MQTQPATAWKKKALSDCLLLLLKLLSAAAMQGGDGTRAQLATTTTRTATNHAILTTMKLIAATQTVCAPLFNNFRTKGSAKQETLI